MMRHPKRLTVDKKRMRSQGVLHTPELCRLLQSAESSGSEAANRVRGVLAPGPLHGCRAQGPGAPLVWTTSISPQRMQEPDGVPSTVQGTLVLLDDRGRRVAQEAWRSKVYLALDETSAGKKVKTKKQRWFDPVLLGHEEPSGSGILCT